MPAVDLLPSRTLARLYDTSGAARWSVPRAVFEAALDRSATHRFGESTPSPEALHAYFNTLHLEDLALAVACAAGDETAWEAFVTGYRPLLYRSARAVARDEAARELADSIYADLFGLVEHDGKRRSLFEYFHGRSALSTWLHAVLARRQVDRARAERHHVALDEHEELVAPRHSDGTAPDPDRARLAVAFDRALEAAIAALDPRDRLRLSLYYAKQMKLAAVGRVLGEHEATVSRKLEKTRLHVRRRVEQILADTHGLGPVEVAACFEAALDERPLDLDVILAPEGPG